MSKQIGMLTLTGERIIPALYDTQFLLDNDLIKSKDDIDNSAYQVSNFATNIELKDDVNTNIGVRPDQIGILSSTSRILNFYNVLKEKQGKIKIHSILYKSIFHFEEPGVFKKNIEKISNFKFLDIDFIRLSKDNHFVTIKECSKDKLHIEITKEIELEKPVLLNNIDIDLKKEILDTHSFANLFFNKHLNLNYVGLP